MTGFETAITGLAQALERPRRHHMWRWLVRHRLDGVRDALVEESVRGGDAWLAPREDTLLRERDSLLQGLDALAIRVMELPDIEDVRRDVKRVVADLDRHRRRHSDLVYDSVALELGGSE
jgi:hypothetical protein